MELNILRLFNVFCSHEICFTAQTINLENYYQVN